LKIISPLRRWISSLDREAWTRFFIGLGGLVIAFASAMLSTAFRDEGNVLATAITASLALITAGVVGVTTIPYLAKRVALERLRFAMRYELTREGLIYLIACIIIAVAALNTGNNLLFIIVAAMLAAILVSGVFSTVTLLNIDLDVSVPEYVFARQSVLGRVAVHNHGRFSAFSLHVVPAKERRGRADKVSAESRLLNRSLYFPRLGSDRTEFENVTFCFEHRGCYRETEFGIATRFPFSFLKKTRIVPLEREITVLPPVDATDDLMESLPIILGEFESFLSGRGHDLYRIREYSPGDPARHIDWKSSAKASSMMVREFAREDERSLRIVFDNPPSGALTEWEYERGINLAASLAWHFANESVSLSFLAPGYDGSERVLDFLKYLALSRPGGKPLSLAEIPVTSANNLMLTGRAPGSIPEPIWASSYVVFLRVKNNEAR
jgi:uncharacterized protein (DUF58 family)